MMTTHPPGPKSWLPGGQLIHFRRDPLALLISLARDFGDVAHFRIGPQNAYLINDPEAIRRVLVTDADNFIKGRALQRAKRLLGEGLLTSENPIHRRQRRLAQPAFHRARIATYAEKIVECAAETAAVWQAGATVDLAHEMNRLALSVVSRTLFDTNTEEEADDIEQAMTSMLALFQYLLLPYTEILERLPLPQVRRFNKARERLDKVIYRIIAEHRANLKEGVDRGDLLSMLLLAQDEEDEAGAGVDGMTDEQVRDEAMTIFLAGHETTANALAWTWYFLGTNPEVERRLHVEVDEVLRSADGGLRLPMADDYARLPYTEQVFAESMRVRPPAWTIGRLAKRDYETLGYTLPVGSLILMSQFVMHHDARYYPEPERFDPERWTPEAKQSRHPYTYFPFGGGARRCIGEGFAWMEGVLVLATLASRWRMRLVPDQRIEMRPLITLRPKYGVRAVLEARSEAHAVAAD